MSTDDSTLRPLATPTTFPLLAELLAEQQRLQTPVARFSATHEVAPAARAQKFRDLIPLSAPGPGEQYAFEVELDRCTGCKACVAGCHSMNGLDEGETWRDVGLLVSGAHGGSYQQTLTTACHHCAEPGCLEGCPVLAYEKDEQTGIVRHLDDQCIGCQYCVLKCPYDVPKYNERLGIVRKCDLCHSRLAVGEAPACVQACPTEAIRIVKVTAGQASTAFPAAAPDPSYTRPTTRYVSKNPIPKEARAADAEILRVQPAHWPLVLMLSCTQLGLGFLLVRSTGLETALPGPWLETLGAAFFLAGLIASVAHLGQPLRAWRIFLNLRASWLSREAVVFGLLAPVVVIFLLAPRVTFLGPLAALSHALLGVLAAVGIFCSAMIYIDTRRKAWRAAVTLPRFFGTVVVAGGAALAPAFGALLLLHKLGLEMIPLLREPRLSTHRVIVGPLRPWFVLRLIAGAAAVSCWAVGATLAGLACFALGEVVERLLYFRSVDAPKMPGGPAT